MVVELMMIEEDERLQERGDDEDGIKRRESVGSVSAVRLECACLRRGVGSGVREPRRWIGCLS